RCWFHQRRIWEGKMNYTAGDRAHDLAWQIAMMELLRRVIGESLYHADGTEFYRRLEILERTKVDSLRGRRYFPDQPEAAENVIKETAATIITGLLTTIRHPSDPSDNRS